MVSIPTPRNIVLVVIVTACVCLCFVCTTTNAFSSSSSSSHPKKSFLLRMTTATTTTTTSTKKIPRIIQGGMGVRISSWTLARSVSKQGELGVVSGTAMDTILVRALQSGDMDGSMRRALASFPDKDMAARILDKYYVENGKDDSTSYRHIPMWSLTPNQHLLEMTVVGNYCEVWLAKHNDDSSATNGLVGINLLTKIQLPTMASLYGAILANVDYVLMGAGIPMEIPGILDNLAKHEDCSMPIHIDGKDAEEPILTFSPEDFWKNAGGKPKEFEIINRPKFLPIVSSVVLAQSMLKRASGAGPTKGIDGFVIELPTAGGHNAPPRGFRYDALKKSHSVDLNEKGEPVYGPKDEVDLLKFGKATKGLPFWLAGSYGRPEKFAEVLELGGAGVQVGTLFALSKESGMQHDTRQGILKRLQEGDLEVFTDPVASPTGFPFKVLDVPDTLSTKEDYAARPRVCNLGYLRTPYMDEDTGKIGYKCPSEPVDLFMKKGGQEQATEGRKCLCNALCADAGFPQVNKKEGYTEQPLVTIGDDVNRCRRFIQYDKETDTLGYSAKDVIEYLVSEWETAHQKFPEEEIKEALLDEKKSKVPASAVGNSTVTTTTTKTDLKP